VLNPDRESFAGAGPLLLVVDNGWGSASHWPERREAIDAARLSAAEGKPTHTLGQVVHNEGVIAQLREQGIRSVRDLDEVDEGLDRFGAKQPLHERPGFLSGALLAGDPRLIEERTPLAVNPHGPFVGQTSQQGAAGARGPAFPTSQLLHDIADRFGGVLPEEVHDLPFGGGNADRTLTHR